jgi:hypothetical protein
MSVVTLTPCVSPQLARALAARLRDAVAAGEQLGSFAFTEGTPAPGIELRDGEELAAAHDFLLRVLRGVSDPLDWRILSAVTSDGTAGYGDDLDPAGLPIDAVADKLELPRLTVTERVNGLIQLGLMARDLEHDSARPSPAGIALFELICELDAEIARWLSKRRKT